MVVALVVLTAGRSGAAKHAPTDIIMKSIAYHDPAGVWSKGRLELGVHTTYSEEYAKKRGVKETNLKILLSPGHEDFSYTKVSGEDKIEITCHKGVGKTIVNGSAEVSDEDKERLRLAEPSLYRDYCEYLYGMPMKLLDPGTNLDPVVATTEFNGKEALALKVSYDPEVGGDIWYFYFDPATFALVGYKFYHDESKNDGEYITFENEVVDEATGMRLPKIRAWYFNDGDGHLATDDIVSMKVSTE